ncbi:cytochrome c [Echinicola marina]|uniref:c-type cytochrome n=1 Tax=Echinicola marina TaxID=2859768 RepID=UPI001CF68A43|nr:cytochrome c [Echinicola marina]UCS93312.1 cytochrome c [Echinicola marina]
MKKRILPLILLVTSLISSCGSGGGGEEKKTDTGTEIKSELPSSIQEGKGVGGITDVELSDEPDAAMVAEGQAIYDMKCASCHKLTDQRVVGPGFQGVTNRRKPEWIMNMITNTDVMLDKDPEAQKLLEECLTRMPNQNVKEKDARDILEFLRRNDLDKTGEKDGAI